MNILHLSDIHFGRNYPEYGLKEPFEKRTEIIDGIIQVLEEMEDGLKPEHIIFTGDITWHGKRKEYQEAVIWFQRLLKACHLTGKDISFCVGNHDIDLSCQFDDIDYDATMVDEIDELYRYDNIHQLEACLIRYNEFCKEIGTIPYTYPLHGKRKYSYSMGYKDITFPGGKKIRILAMNTALLMTQRKIPDDKMWMGREQLNSLLRYGILPAGEDIWYTVGLFHHSERFLHPNESSSYDGRSATLPSLMGYANLLACGHTESSGKPRLAKQPGGATMLFGGAAYYNDNHVNSFSMIYISEKKKSMGYIPYIYEGTWKDYDFCNHEERLVTKSILEDLGEVYENVELVLESDLGQYVIPFDYLEFRDYGRRIHSDMDLMNDFHLEYDIKKGDEVILSCREEKEHYMRTLCVYDDFVHFIKGSTESKIKCCLKNQQGDRIVEFSGVVYEPILEYDENFKKDILFLEEEFDVRFTLPNTVSKKEYEKIHVLKDIAKYGCNHYEIGTYGENPFSIRLFHVDIRPEKKR